MSPRPLRFSLAVTLIVVFVFSLLPAGSGLSGEAYGQQAGSARRGKNGPSTHTPGAKKPTSRPAARPANDPVPVDDQEPEEEEATGAREPAPRQSSRGNSLPGNTAGSESRTNQTGASQFPSSQGTSGAARREPPPFDRPPADQAQQQTTRDQSREQPTLSQPSSRTRRDNQQYPGTETQTSGGIGWS